MNSFERTMMTINHQEPDRVPLFLLLSYYGAKELQLDIKTYFSNHKNVVEAQLKMKEKYDIDCLYTFFYAAIEVEAFGGEVIFSDEGPPNSGQPFIKSLEDIAKIQMPDIKGTACLKRVLDTTKMLKSEVGDEVPIIGVVMSPFSLPIMQMGFEKYLDLLYFHKEDFEKLMRINEEFCIAWANAQLEAGATAICYFNPLASPSIIEKKTYLSSGFELDKRTISKINGPTATHLASGITLPVIDEIISTKTAVLGFSANDHLENIKNASKDRICLLGNLNAVEMVRWTPERIHEEIKNIIHRAGSGGGLILSDNHGEIPWQVPEEVLLEISKAVKMYGTYPLKQV